MLKKTLAALVVAGSLAALPAAAHHSGAMFGGEPVTLEGVVVEFQYTNPHSWLIIDVTNADGTITRWGFEAEGPSTLLRAGIRQSDFTPGTPVRITGTPMLDGRPGAAWRSAVRLTDNAEFNPGAGFAIR